MSRNTAGPFWPLAVYLICVLTVVVVMVALSFVLGQRKRDRGAGVGPYESGIVPTGDAGIRFAARFYLIAALFLVFDMETVFVMTWSVAARELGWRGYIALVAFISMLAAALIYLWRSGALDWKSSGKNETTHLSETGVKNNASTR